MKTTFRLLSVCLLMLVFLCGCNQTNPKETTASPATEVTYPYDFTSEDFFYVKDFLSYDYIPMAKLDGVKADGSFFDLPNFGGFTVMQGGCTDGKYCYLYLADTDYNYEGQSMECGMLFKVDMSNWQVVKQSDPLPLSHGNGMCYNSKLNKIIVSYCNNYSHTPEDETKMVAFVDPETLTVAENKMVPMSINAIDYNAKHDLYVVGIKGNSAAFAVLDLDDNGEFVELGYYDGHNIGLVSQDVDCDDNYIYVGNSSVGTEHAGKEAVRVYDWDGEYKGIFLVQNMQEQEALFNYGGKYYITFFGGSGGRVYQINYDFSLLGE